MQWLKGGKIYLEDRILEHSAIGFSDNIIKVICSAENAPNNAEVMVLNDDDYVLPGLIDLHIHGAMGADVMDATQETLQTISTALKQEGITAFLPTLMTESPLKIQNALDAIAQFKTPTNGAEILGAYLEGPFLSCKKCGAQNTHLIQKPSIEFFKQFESELIKIVTIAPEEDHEFALIKYLKEKNIIPSVGHTAANYEIMQEAIKAGITHVTHLFNASTGIHQREPGTVTACLLDKSVTLELIVDGIHLHPAIVKMVYQLCGAERIILMTDALRAKGLADGEYELGGQKVFVKNKIAKIENGALAGSMLTMNNAIKNMIKFTHCSMQDIVKMTAENPAKKLNVFDRLGSITVGKKADFCLLDSKLNNLNQ